MKLAAAAFAAVWLAAAPAAAQTPYAPAELPAPGESVCPGGLCQAGALEGVFEALAATEAGTRDRPVHVLQIGDSHTAGDLITGGLRARLQGRFGGAGRGVLPPGSPYVGYRPFQVQVTTIGWVQEAAPLQTPAGAPTPRMGLGGFRATGGASALMAYDLEPGAEATTVGLCGRARGPGAGLAVEANGTGRGVDFNTGVADQEVCRELVLSAPAAQVRLLSLEEGVVLDSVSLTQAGPGVIVSNLGMVSSTLRDFAARDEAIVATQLGTWRPALIVLAYGTNEGFDDALDPAAYERLLRAQIARLRRLAPAASLMLLGAPDGLRGVATGGCSADGLREPPRSLAVVRDVQRRTAADLGVAFWDWQGRMGGACSADRLASRPDPYMRGDRVHFTNVGADWIGGVLADDLMGAYEAWKAAREGQAQGEAG